MRSITIVYGANHAQAVIDFIGFDYRAFNSGHCAERDYVDLYTNPNNGEVVICNHGGQWSRETVVTVYSNMQEYRNERDLRNAKMRQLTGR